MREQYSRFLERDLVLLNLGPDDAAAYRSYWKKNDIPFVGLADPKHVAAKAYQQPVRLLKLGRMPLQVVVDPDGVIRFRHESNGMSDTPSCDQLLVEIDGIMKSAATS